MSEKEPAAATGDVTVTDRGGKLDRRTLLASSLAGAWALALSRAGYSAPSNAPQQSGSTANEVWVQPWEWRVWEHGVDPLPLVVTEASNPDLLAGAGGTLSVAAALFTYGGVIPGPTIRTKGDAVVRVQLLNTLSGNNGTYAADSGSRFAVKSYVPGCGDFEPNVPVPCLPDWRLADSLLYGPHSQHTTNLHTHGLHVSTQKNPVSGAHSDNVLLRLIPHEDMRNRESHVPQIPLKPTEFVGDLQYEFRLGTTAGPHVETHAPGTHWYHPHPHGATWDQVSTGMAGFFIVEGDVEETINDTVATTDADPSTKSGPNDYRERVMLIQRIAGGTVSEAERGPGSQRKSVAVSVNGQTPGDLSFHMRPGAIERWRVLNGSVDGQGYVNFMVVKGEPDLNEPTPVAERADLSLLAFDGVGLVRAPGGEYYVQDLSGESQNTMMLGPANRSDFLFQAPPEEGTYTILAEYVAGAVDKNPLAGQNQQNAQPSPAGKPNIKVATITVDGGAVAGNATIADINRALGRLQAPGLLQPVRDEELIVGNFESAAANPSGDWRCRRIVYAGWGADSSKKMTGEPDPAAYSKGSVGCDNQNFGEPNTMTIDGRKFDSGTAFHTMAVGSAEQWTLENQSLTIIRNKATGAASYGVDAETALRGGDAASYAVVASSVDHPFHIHQNPFWVTRIQAGDGTDLDWNYEPLGDNEFRPRWQDVVRIPRNGGRITFRSRFWNFTGEYVNHCHLLQHEDMGMMQTVAVVPNPFDADYEAMPAGNEYAWPTLKDMYYTCLLVVSPQQAQQPSKLEMFCAGVPQQVGNVAIGANEKATHFGDKMDTASLPCVPAVAPPD